MFVFSKSIGEKTGNLAVNQAQWRALELEPPVLRQQLIFWRALSSGVMQKTPLISTR